MTDPPLPTPSARRRANQDPTKLSASNDDLLYRLLVENVRDYAIFALDTRGHILTWNIGAERLKGYRPEEIVGKHFSVFYTEEDRNSGKAERELREARETGRYEEEGWRVRKDGTRFWAHVILTALRDDSGEIVGFGKITHDLSEQRAAEEELRQSEERVRLMVQSVRDYAIFRLDAKGYIASWNEGAQRINGYTPEEIIGKHFSIFYPPEDLAWDKPGYELVVAARDGRFEDEGWRIKKDGSRYWANVVITALRHPGGDVLGFVKVTRDLTERKASELQAVEDARRLAIEEASRRVAEQRAHELAELLGRMQEQALELERQRAEAERANRAKSEFLAMMSHELRTPLNAIGGYAELLLMGIRGSLTEQQRDDVERMRRSQQHLLALINDVLNFSRLEAGRVTYDIETVALAEVVEGVSTMVQPQVVAKGLALHAKQCPRELRARADRDKIGQILLNLLSNAVKFTNPGGEVWISCAVEGERVSMSVRDTGRGIAPDQLERIFEPFVQLEPSLTRTSEGTGLGLAISRDLARGMSGNLTAKSAVGEGSTFTLTLPRAK